MQAERHAHRSSSTWRSSSLRSGRRKGSRSKTVTGSPGKRRAAHLGGLRGGPRGLIGHRPDGVSRLAACRSVEGASSPLPEAASAELVYKIAPCDLGWSLCSQFCACHHRLRARVGFGVDDADAGLGQHVEAHVAAALGPLVGLLGEYSAHEAHEGVAVGEDPTTSVRRRANAMMSAQADQICDAGWGERSLWGSRSRARPVTSGSGCGLVLVDQAAEDRSTPDPAVNRLAG